MVDLQQKIQQWRQTLAMDASISADALDELEAHLRDSMQQLASLGLSEEECFLIATHRLGRPAVLQAEFAKECAAGLWKKQLLWAVAGVLTFEMIGRTTSFGVFGASTGLAFLGMTDGRLQVASLIVATVGQVAMLAVLIWLCVRVKKVGLLGMGGLLLVGMLATVAHVVLQSLMTAKLAPSDFGRIALGYSIPMFVGNFVTPLALIGMYLFLRRPERPAATLH